MNCAIPVHCFTNWANKPTGSWSQRLWSVGLTVFLILKWSTVDIITIMVLLFHLLFFAFNRILCSCHSNIKIYIFFPSCNILNLLAEWAFPNISLADRSDTRSCMCAINNSKRVDRFKNLKVSAHLLSNFQLITPHAPCSRLDTNYFRNFFVAPSAPPSNIRVTAFHSQSLLVSWLDVPTEHRNGIIRGYRLTYTNVSNRTGPVITERAYSVVLTQLRKATEYRILLWAFNSAGDGVSGSVVAKTGEDGGFKNHHPPQPK